MLLMGVSMLLPIILNVKAIQLKNVQNSPLNKDILLDVHSLSLKTNADETFAREDENLDDLEYYELVTVKDEQSPMPSKMDENKGADEIHPKERRLLFDGHGRKFDLHLYRNDIIPAHLKLISQNHKDGGKSHLFNDRPIENCYYHGRMDQNEKDDETFIAAGSMCDHGFRGVLKDQDDVMFILRPLNEFPGINDEPETSRTHVLYKTSDIKKEKLSDTPVIDVDPEQDGSHVSYHTLSKVLKYIELIPIVSHERFLKLNKNMTECVKLMIGMMNQVDLYYRQMNTRVVMTHLIVWDHSNAATPNQGGIMYYSEEVMWKQLGLRFDHVPHIASYKGILGVAHWGSICTPTSVSTQTVGSVLYGANVVAHELGHSIGFHHQDCRENGKQTIMCDYASGEYEMFSSATKRRYEYLIEQKKVPCFYNKPKSSFIPNTCGNGVKEIGELCDCISEAECRRRGEFECCDPTTCQLRAGLQCSEGVCCKDCMFKSKNETCRSPNSDVCAGNAKCTGLSEHCPAQSFSMKPQPAIKVGCYKLKTGHNRGSLLYNGRTNLVWESSKYGASVKQTLCKCAQVAKDRKAVYFGLHYWAECWSLKKEDIEKDEDGKCLLADGKWESQTKCTRDNHDNSDYACNANGNNYFVYRLEIPPEIPRQCPAKKWQQIGDEPPTKKGCFTLKKGAKLTPLINYDHAREWFNWGNFIKKIVCECRDIAKKKGGKYIAMHDLWYCSMVDEKDLEKDPSIPTGECQLADNKWTGSFKVNSGHRYRCSKDLHKDSEFECTGNQDSHNYFVYQIAEDM